MWQAWFNIDHKCFDLFETTGFTSAGDTFNPQLMLPTNPFVEDLIQYWHIQEVLETVPCVLSRMVKDFLSYPGVSFLLSIEITFLFFFFSYISRHWTSFQSTLSALLKIPPKMNPSAQQFYQTPGCRIQHCLLKGISRISWLRDGSTVYWTMQRKS